jgi:hypothetical protein
VQEKNLDLLSSLLAEDGTFNTKDGDLNPIDNSSKVEFLSWFLPVLSETNISSIEYDNCILCKTGNPVVLFNDGQFPAMKVESANKSMTGLMLDISDGLIKEIAFCYSFASRENKYQFECNSEEVDKLIAQGVPLMEAIEIVLTKKGYKDIW